MAEFDALPYELLEGILLEAAKDDIVSANTIPFVSHLWKRLISQHPPQQFKWYNHYWDQKAYNISIAKEAALRGYIEVLKWLKENACPFGDGLCAEAAEGGHLEILKWLKNEGGCNLYTDASAGAAKGGHLEILRWLKENGCPWDVRSCEMAALGGHFEVLKWLKENGYAWNVPGMHSPSQMQQQQVTLKWQSS